MSAYKGDLGTRTVAPAASIVITLNATPSSSNLVFLESLFNGSAVITAVADSKGNTWTQIGSPVATTAPITRLYHWYTLQNVAPLVSGDTVTLTVTVGTGTSSASILRELASTGPDVNVNLANNSSSTTANTGTTGATTQATEIVWESLGTGSTVSSWTQDAAYSLPTTSLLQTQGAGRTLLSAYRDVTATGTQSAANTLGTAAFSATKISTFKVAAGGGTAWSQPLADTITLSDATAKAVGANKADTLTQSEGFTPTSVWSRSFADTITDTDAIAKSVSMPLADATTLSDAISKGAGLGKADALTLSDAVVKAMGLGKADGFTLTDAAAKSVAHALADALTISESFTPTITGAGVNYTKNLADVITIADALHRTLSDSGASPGAANHARVIFLDRFGLFQ